MPRPDNRDPQAVEERIREIKTMLAERGGRMLHWQADDLPDDVRLQFWERVLTTDEDIS